MAGKRGNRNALKHGLYSKRFTPEENELMALELDLNNELRLLRAYVYRITGMLEGREYFHGKELGLVDRLNAMCGTIGTLTTRRLFETGRTPEVQKAITAAILEIAPMAFPHLTRKR